MDEQNLFLFLLLVKILLYLISSLLYCGIFGLNHKSVDSNYVFACLCVNNLRLSWMLITSDCQGINLLFTKST